LPLALDDRKLAIIAAIATYLSTTRRKIRSEKPKRHTSYWKIAAKMDILRY